MGIVILWIVFLSASAMLVVLTLIISSDNGDNEAARWMKAKPYRLSDDKLLLSRWKLNQKLYEMRKEQKRIGW